MPPLCCAPFLQEISGQICESVARSLEGQKLTSFTGVSTFVRQAFENSLSGILNKRQVGAWGWWGWQLQQLVQRWEVQPDDSLQCSILQAALPVHHQREHAVKLCAAARLRLPLLPYQQQHICLCSIPLTALYPAPCTPPPCRWTC